MITVVTKDDTVRPLSVIVFLNGRCCQPSALNDDGSLAETGEYEWDLQTDMPRFHFKVSDGDILQVLRNLRVLDVYRIDSEQNLGSYVATHLSRFDLSAGPAPAPQEPPKATPAPQEPPKVENPPVPQEEFEVEMPSQEPSPNPLEVIFQNHMTSEEKRQELVTRTVTTLLHIIEGRVLGTNAETAMSTIDFFRRRLQESGIDYDNLYANVGEKLTRIGDLVDQARYTR